MILTGCFITGASKASRQRTGDVGQRMYIFGCLLRVKGSQASYRLQLEHILLPTNIRFMRSIVPQESDMLNQRSSIGMLLETFVPSIAIPTMITGDPSPSMRQSMPVVPVQRPMFGLSTTSYTLDTEDMLSHKIAPFKTYTSNPSSSF